MYILYLSYVCYRGTWTHDEDSFLALTPFFVKRSSHSLTLNFEPSFTTEFGIRSPVRDGDHDNGVSQMAGFFHSRWV